VVFHNKGEGVEAWQAVVAPNAHTLHQVQGNVRGHPRVVVLCGRGTGACGILALLFRMYRGRRAQSW